MTEARTTSYARFYFRPLTPTQYYNEGFKHAKIRFSGDINANVPVPVFLVFNLESLLMTKGVLFSAQSQAGHGSPVKQGEVDFSNLPFDKIYSDGPCDEETRRYRHAEILIPGLYQIDSSLRMIACRNECEKATLLNLLYNKDPAAYEKYKDHIRVVRGKMFQRNGLYVDNVVYHQSTICFEFACTPEKKKYEQQMKRKFDIEGDIFQIVATYEFQWISTQGEIIYSTVVENALDYLSPRRVVFKLPPIEQAYALQATVRLDGKIICVTKQPIESFEMV